jgi:hypothetical protein
MTVKKDEKERVGNEEMLPVAYALLQNYPNP